MSNYKNGKYIRRRNEAIAKQHERFDPVDAPLCKQFGCGKQLTPTEFLFSEYCFKHAKQNNNEANQIQLDKV